VRQLSKRSLNAPTELEIHRSELRNKYLNSTKYTFTLQWVNFVNKASLHDLCTYLQHYPVYRKTTVILNKQATLDKTPFPHTAKPTQSRDTPFSTARTLNSTLHWALVPELLLTFSAEIHQWWTTETRAKHAPRKYQSGPNNI